MRLELAAVSKWFGARCVLNQLWLQVRAAEAVGLVGANGASKTTILRIAAGLVRPDEGWSRWSCGPDLSDSERLRVRYFGGECTMPPGVRADRWAALFGGAEPDRRRIGRLSRGTRQRLGLRATLECAEADLILLDEPWEGLDPEGSAWLAAEVQRWRRAGAGILISSHRLHDLAGACDRVLMLEKGRCRVVEIDAGLIVSAFDCRRSLS